MENKDNKQAHEHEAQKANTRTKDSKQELNDEQLEKVAGGGDYSCLSGYTFNPLLVRCVPNE